MFLIPSLMALAVSRSWKWSSLLLLLAFGLIFISHRPATTLLLRWNRRRVVEIRSLTWTGLLGGTGVVLGSVLFLMRQQWAGLGFGLIAGVAFVIHLLMTLRREQMSLPGEIIGVVGLTASGPLVYLYVNNGLDAWGWVLWMITLLYFTGSVFYVKLKLRIQPSMAKPDLGRKFKVGLPTLSSAGLTLSCLLIVTLLRGYTALFIAAFVPYYLKVLWGVSSWQSKERLNITRFGFTEVAHSVIFCLVSIAAFYSSSPQGIP